MSKFLNVSVVQAANVYFNGAVTSRTVEFADGSTKTLGIMLPGEYTFNTGARELMEIYSGKLSVLTAEEEDAGNNWSEINGGESFVVAQNSSFKVKVSELTDYCCSFLA